MNLKNKMKNTPYVAILRGLLTEEAILISQTLLENEINFIEVPLTSSNAMDCIRLLKQHFGDKIHLGIGTALTTEDVSRGHQEGIEFVVMPNTNPKVIAKSKELGLLTIPGFQTVSEAFTALDAGADALKIFPFRLVPPAALQDMQRVLPKDVIFVPTGNLQPENIIAYNRIGIKNFGLGSAIYTPSMKRTELIKNLQPYLGIAKSILRSE